MADRAFLRIKNFEHQVEANHLHDFQQGGLQPGQRQIALDVVRPFPDSHQHFQSTAGDMVNTGHIQHQILAPGRDALDQLLLQLLAGLRIDGSG